MADQREDILAANPRSFDFGHSGEAVLPAGARPNKSLTLIQPPACQCLRPRQRRCQGSTDAAQRDSQ